MEKQTFKNEKWKSLLEFDSVKTYLSGSIGSKKSQIGQNLTLEDKIKNVDLSRALLGLQVFLTEYMQDKDVISEFGKSFAAPHEIIDYYDEIRTDKSKLNEFIQLVENYTIWLKTKKVKKNGLIGLAPSTSQNYQAQLRGFLSWNNVNLKFKNYDEDTEISKLYDEYSIGFEELIMLGRKMIEYAQDFELKTLMKWMFISGLGSKELISITKGQLINKDFSKEFVMLSGRRVKSGVKFITFIYGETKADIMKLINTAENQKKSENELLFGEAGQSTERIYNNFERKVKRAYKRLINEQFPQYQNAPKSLFTLHKYRHIFQTICVDLRVPKKYENLFVAHKQSNKLEKRYVLNNREKLLKNFKLIQDELFGLRESNTRDEIKREIINNLTDALLNRGERRSDFRKSRELTEEEMSNLGIKTSFNILTEQLINTAKAEILKDDAFLEEMFLRFKKFEQ